MQTAAQIEEQQRAQQFEYDMKLKQAELENQKAKEKEIEIITKIRTRVFGRFNGQNECLLQTR